MVTKKKWDQRRNQRPWNKWKWEYNNPKSVEHRENSPKGEIHSLAGQSQEKRKSLNKQPNFSIKGARKRKQKQNIAQSLYKEGNDKAHSRNKGNRI